MFNFQPKIYDRKKQKTVNHNSKNKSRNERADLNEREELTDKEIKLWIITMSRI